MYMQDGKKVVPDYGRRNPGVNRQDFEALKTDFIKLRNEFEALKAEAEPKAVDVDIEALKAEAIVLGIEVKGTWGAKKLASAIEDAKASKE